MHTKYGLKTHPYLFQDGPCEGFDFNGFLKEPKGSVNEFNQWITNVIQKEPGNFFTFKDFKARYDSEVKGGATYNKLKADLERFLDMKCLEQSRIKGKKYRSVFKGFKLVESTSD